MPLLEVGSPFVFKTVDLSIAAVNDAPVILNPMSKQYIDEDNVLSISETSLLATMAKLLNKVNLDN